LFEFFCNTSPLQYLHQLDLLPILPALLGKIVVPPAVLKELEVGKSLGIQLPELTTCNWITIRQPKSLSALPLVVNLGRGETEVLMLALESNNPMVILDDALARRIAQVLKIPLTGTLGLLIDAKQAGLISAVAPFLSQLQILGFRLATQTRAEVLRMAKELPEL